MHKLHRLVDEACRDLPVGVHRQDDIRRELLEHLDDTVAELQAVGLAPPQVMEQAAARFGDPAEVRARLIENLQGGPTAMWRRVMVPALLTASGIALLAALGYGTSHLSRHLVDSQRFADWLLLLPLAFGWLSWLTVPLIFGGCYLCGARGGTKRECVIVGFSPLAVVVPFFVYLLIPLAPGSVSAGTATLGTVIARSGILSSLIEWIGKCAVGTGLYLIAFHRIQLIRRHAPLEPARPAQ